MSFTVIIPARLASTRLPGKALLDLCGKSMIQRVYEQASQSDAKQVIVATDDVSIEREVIRFGGNVSMTSIDHVSGTDRVQEVCSQCGLDPDEVVVNVQGDEPIIPPRVINQVARNLVSPNVESVSRVATLYEPIDNLQDTIDPNVVKVVVDVDGMALYFSRAPIPWDRDRMPEGFSNGAYKRHVGIYAYKVGMLNEYVTWQADEIELVEKLEQLRILRQGHRIHIDKAVQSIPPGIDTPQDLERTRAYLESRAPQ